jgi:hypothetical protein
MHAKKLDRKTPVLQATAHGTRAQKRHPLSVSPADDLHLLIANRAYELYRKRGSEPRCALDDWLQAEHEILSPTPPI